MRVIFTLFFLFSVALPFIAQDLPKGFTEAEKKIYKTYNHPNNIEGITVPPSFEPRTMAEWEELQGIMIAWTSYTTILRQIVDYAQEEGIVYIVCSDSNSVKSTLNSYSIPLTNIQFLHAGFNSIWCRDYGPWTIYDENGDNLSIVDWVYNRPRPQDDLVPESIGNMLGLDVYSTTSGEYELVNTGGNFLTDGKGNGFASRLIYSENPSLSTSQVDNILSEFMGIESFRTMQTLPYDNIHHIDMHMKLLDEETLLVGQYPEGVADGPQIEANLQYILDNYQTCYGRPYKVVRIPMPPDNGYYPNTSGDYRTYTNSLIVNKTVIVPTYEYQYDTTALRIYRDAMPGYNVVGIDCNQIIGSLGAVHCITKEIGVSDPITIFHAPVREAYYPGNYPIEVEIISPVTISGVSVYWSVDPDNEYNEVQLNNVGDGFYSGEIPQQERGDVVHYYISASNSNGKTITKPITAPDGYYKFVVPEESFLVDISVNSGWNLLSVPVKTNDMAAGTIFENVEGVVYGFGSSYFIADQLENGAGYWAKFATAGEVELRGTSVMDNITVSSGWNIVAPYKDKIGVDDVASVPANIVNSPFYYFDNGYHVADTLIPGMGYWVKTSSDGELSYYADNLAKANEAFEVSTIRVQDAAGNSSELFVLGEGISESYYTCPPCGPGNSFFVSFDDNTLAIKSGLKTLDIKNAEYPVTLYTNADVTINGTTYKKGSKFVSNTGSINIEVVETPTEFSLEQNYPNPFNPSTTISFAIPESGNVKVNIYDMLGRKVKSLVNENMDAGYHKVTINASELASGVYLYTLEAGNISLTRKMMLLK